MELDYRSGFYHRGLSTGSVTIVTSDYTKRAQHWINDSEYDRFHILYIYIYVLEGMRTVFHLIASNFDMRLSSNAARQH